MTQLDPDAGNRRGKVSFFGYRQPEEKKKMAINDPLESPVPHIVRKNPAKGGMSVALALAAAVIFGLFLYSTTDEGVNSAANDRNPDITFTQ